jgi:hypothetical protein
MRSWPRIRRRPRLALILILLATVIGAGRVLGHGNPDDSIPVRGSAELPPTADLEDGTMGHAHKPGDCRNLNASFLDSACHAVELRKRHPGHSAHRVATVLIGHADAREPGAE